MQKRCKQTLRMQSLFQTLCHEIPQKATIHMRSNTHGNKTFQTMRNVIYTHIVKRPEGKDTLVKDLGKKNLNFHIP